MVHREAPPKTASAKKIGPCEQRQLRASAGCRTSPANLGASLIRRFVSVNRRYHDPCGERSGEGARSGYCYAGRRRWSQGTPVDSSANLDRPRRQRPGSHAVGSPRHPLVLCGRCGRSSSDKSTITQGARSVDSRRRRPVHRHPCGLATAGRRRTLFGTSGYAG